MDPVLSLLHYNCIAPSLDQKCIPIQRVGKVVLKQMCLVDGVEHKSVNSNSHDGPKGQGRYGAFSAWGKALKVLACLHNKRYEWKVNTAT